MKHYYLKSALCLLMVFISGNIWAQHPITVMGAEGIYTQNFNDFRGTAATLPANWAVSGSYNGTASNRVVTAGSSTPNTSTANGNNVYAGRASTSSSDYSILQKQATSGSSTFTFSTINDSDSTINGFTITWNVEQFCLAGRPATVNFQYRLNGGSYTNAGITGTTLYTCATGTTANAFSFVNGTPTAYSITITGITMDIDDTADFQFVITSGGGSGSNPHVGIDDFNITASGTASSSPVLLSDPASLSGFTYYEGNGPSASQSFEVSGANLESVVSVTASANYEVSSDNNTFSQSFDLGNAATYTDVPVYVRLKSGLLNGTRNGTVTLSGGGAADKVVNLTGVILPGNDLCGAPTALTVNAAATPGSLANATITAPFATVDDDGINDVWYSVTPNTTGEHIITLTDYSGDADLWVFTTQCPSNPNGFLASSILDDPTETITLNLTASQTYYIRVSSYDAAASVSGFTIRITAVAPCTVPAAQPTLLSFGGTTDSAIAGSFTATTADSYLVVRSTSSSLSASPADQTTYAPGSTFGGGTVVQFSNSTSFSASGLSGATQYYFFIYAANNVACSGGPVYRTALPLTGSTSTQTAPCMTQDFTANSTPAGWLAQTISYTESADVASFNGNTGELVTPALIHPVALSFDLARTSNATAKTLYVEVSTTSQTTGFGAAIATYTHDNTPSNSSATYILDLSAYATAPAVYVRFRKEGTSTSPWRMDNVKVSCSESVYWLANNTWSNGTPGSTKDVVILGAKTVAPADSFSARSLTVNNGASIAIQSGATVTVNGAIANNAGEDNFTVASNGNLMQDENATANTNTGSISISRNVGLRLYDYVYWSSPVDGQKVRAFSPLTVESRFYLLDEENNTYKSLFLPAAAGMGYDPLAYEFVPGKGYMVRAPGDYTASIQTFTGTFKGVPHNGDYTIQATKGAGVDAQGYNIIGNPYPSPIDAAEFVAGNDGIGTLYFWSHYDQVSGINNYASWNGTGSANLPGVAVPNGTIQVGQGFVVQVAATMDVNFTNGMRVNDHNDQFYRNANTGNGGGRLWLDLYKNGVAQHQALIGYVDGATDGNDLQFDGKLFNEGKSSLYSVIDGGKYVIQGKGLPFTDTDVVPLGFQAIEAGTYTIALGNTDGVFAGNQDIFLKDNTTGTLHDIKGGAYQFASEAGTFESRFEVVYMNALGTDIPESTAKQVVVYTTDHLLHVNSGSLEMTGVKVFDIRGRLVAEKQATGTSASLAMTAGNQVLIVQIATKTQGIVTRKVVF